LTSETVVGWLVGHLIDQVQEVEERADGTERLGLWAAERPARSGQQEGAADRLQRHATSV
jgi:hypothetical protein